MPDPSTYRERVEILLWLAPPVVVTVVAMLWVGWVGRERAEVDRDEAVRRLGAALDKDPAPLPQRTRPRRQRSTGVALRRTPRRPVVRPLPGRERPQDPGHERRAS